METSKFNSNYWRKIYIIAQYSAIILFYLCPTFKFNLFYFFAIIDLQFH